jgi:hypothetical protein
LVERLPNLRQAMGLIFSTAKKKKKRKREKKLSPVDG